MHVISAGKPRLQKSRKGRWRAFSLLGVHVLVAAHLAHWWSAGRTLSPVEPSESMETFRNGAVNAGILFFGLAILATFIFGRFFCGWGCHLVAYQDLMNWFLKKVHWRPKALRSRFLIYIPVIAAFYMFGVPIVARLWTKYVRETPVPGFSMHLTKIGFWDTFPTPLIGAMTFLICGFAIVFFMGPKGFCTFACPYGAIFGVADKFAKGRIRVTDACEGCGHCTAVCTSNVSVAQEVRDYGMVVDPGCMRCMDCVSVCPNDALYFGFGSTALGVRKPDAAPKPRYDLSLSEELAALLIFATVFFTYRGIYGGRIPFLFSLGVAGIATVVFIKAARLFYQPEGSLQKLRFKVGGRWKPIGVAFAAAALALLALTIHSAIWQYEDYCGGQSFGASPPSYLGWQYEPGLSQSVSDRQREAMQAGLGHLGFAERIGLLDPLDNHLEAAWMSVHTGDAAGARRHLDRAIGQSPDNPMLYVHRANVATVAGDRAAAEADFQQALQLEAPPRERLTGKLGHVDLSTSAKVWLEWAMFLDHAGRPAEAESAFNRAIEFDRTDADAPMALGEFLIRAQRYDEGRRALIEALSRDASNHRAAQDLLTSGKLEPQNFQAAAEDYRQALSLHSDNVLFRRNRAYALAQVGRYPESLAEYAECLRRLPGADDIRGEFGAILLVSGDVPGAIREYEAILRSRPNEPEAALRLGQLYEMANRPGDARRSYQAVLQNGSDSQKDVARQRMSQLP